MERGCMKKINIKIRLHDDAPLHVFDLLYFGSNEITVSKQCAMTSVALLDFK